MLRKSLRSIIRRPWLRMGLAVALLIVGLAPVGAPILSDNALRQALGATPGASTARTFSFRYDNLPDGTARILRREVGSQNWSGIALLPDNVQQLEASQAGMGQVYARTGSGIWHSSDAGATWTEVSALPSRPLSLAVARETEGLIMAGTAESGLYVSFDSGKSWRAAGGSLSMAGPGSLAVPSVAFNPTDDRVVYAIAELTMATPQGSHVGRQAFLSPDGGTRWFQMQPKSPAIESPSANAVQARLVPANDRPLEVTAGADRGAETYELSNVGGLVSGLDDPDPATRAATARVLGLSEDRSLAASLAQHLGDPDLAAGDRIAEALGLLGDRSVVPDMMHRLQDRDEVVRARAAYVLGRLKYEPAVPQLESMLRSDGPLARQRAADGLAAIGSSDAISALVGPLADAGMTPARYAAMQGLDEAGSRAVPQLLAALKDAQPVVRRNAAEALGWIGSPEPVAGLSNLLTDANADVRGEAAWALGEIGTPEAQQALARTVTDGTDQVTRQAARTALAQAQNTHRERFPVSESPLSAFMQALTQIPASRWTLLFLVILLAAILFAVRPDQVEKSHA